MRWYFSLEVQGSRWLLGPSVDTCSVLRRGFEIIVYVWLHEWCTVDIQSFVRSFGAGE